MPVSQSIQGLASQRGLTLGSMLLLLILVTPAAGITLKLVPVYVDHNFLVSSTRNLVETRSSTSLTQTMLRQEVAESMRINNIRHIDPRSITLTHISGRPQVRIRYERRVPLIYNIDLIVSFDEQVN